MPEPTVTRRQLLQLAAAGSLTLTWPRNAASVLGSIRVVDAGVEFLDASEVALVEAITSRILPTDGTPGAREAGVVHYIQALLSALPSADANCDQRTGAGDLIAMLKQLGAPADPSCGADVDADGTVTGADVTAALPSVFSARPIFAGGPFSGRTPFGDFDSGQILSDRPGNSFRNSLPLNRVQRLAWKARLDGVGTVPELAANPLAQSQPDVDLRQRYRDGLAAVAALSQQRFGQPFPQLTAVQQGQILTLIDAGFLNLITNHTLEGMFAAPEYGGNRNLVGWQLIGFDGDSQPLGYTLGFDEQTQTYIERPDKPNSRPDPTETCVGFSAPVVRFLSLVIAADDTQPAMRFRNPFCFNPPPAPTIG